MNICFLKALKADEVTLANNHIDYFSPGHYNLICCESHLSQAKKVLELCFKEQLGEAEKWAEEIKKLQIMTV